MSPLLCSNTYDLKRDDLNFFACLCEGDGTVALLVEKKVVSKQRSIVLVGLTTQWLVVHLPAVVSDIYIHTYSTCFSQDGDLKMTE